MIQLPFKSSIKKNTQSEQLSVKNEMNFEMYIIHDEILPFMSKTDVVVDIDDIDVKLM